MKKFNLKDAKARSVSSGAHVKLTKEQSPEMDAEHADSLSSLHISSKQFKAHDNVHKAEYCSSSGRCQSLYREPEKGVLGSSQVTSTLLEGYLKLVL